MIFYVIDDEPPALRISHQVIQEAFPNAQVLPFGDATEALNVIASGSGSRTSCSATSRCRGSTDLNLPFA